jgi:hypothetical protein
MKKNLVIVFSLFLIGCGSSETLSSNDTFTHRFHIGDTTWQINLPENWATLPLPENIEAIFAAHNHTHNFAILRKNEFTSDMQKQMWENAKQKFFWFQEIDFQEEKWSFQAKTSAAEPPKIYIQKLFPIEKTSFFLFGSCSLPAMENRTECDRLLDSWKISVDKTVEEK